MALILVADDEPDIVRLIAVTLERAGHEVVTAADGFEAVQTAVERRPDAVLLDVMMPRMDGLTALRQLREGPVTQHIPVVLVSAKSESIDIDIGMKAGAAAYISKPFKPADLAAEVARLTTT
jgi:CheY-like chemotaxis protein